MKQCPVDQNEKVSLLEKDMQMKMGVLTAWLMTRHKNGSTIDDLLEHARKAESDLQQDQAFTSAFRSIVLCSPSALKYMLANEPGFVRDLLEGLLEQTRGVTLGYQKNNADTKSLAEDVRLKQLRALLIEVVNNNQADQDLKTSAVRLMLRLGYIFGSAQDLLMAADLQETLCLDISWDLMPLLDKSEKLRKYIPPFKSSDNGEPYAWNDQRCIQSRVSFLPPSQSDRTGDDDTAGCDNTHYFMWSKTRGLFSGTMDPQD